LFMDMFGPDIAQAAGEHNRFMIAPPFATGRSDLEAAEIAGQTGTAEFVIKGRCTERAAGAGLLTMLSIVLVVSGIATWRLVRRRPVDPEGSSRFVWGLGLLFALGLGMVAVRIPAFACEQGRFDAVLQLCMHPPTTSEPTSWLWLKRVVVVVGLLGGGSIAVTPRRVRLWVPLSVAAWVVGTGWVVLDALVIRGD